MKVMETSLPGVMLLTPTKYCDSRGMFMETYNQQAMQEAGLPTRWCQDNFSVSARHVVRGLHYQITQPQGKLIRVISGVALDVAVDLRKSSPSYGKHLSIELRDSDHTMLYIPAGFGHGFLALSEHVGFSYKVTDYYSAQAERTIRWNDSLLAIDWPVAEEQAIVSAKDQAGASFATADVFA